MKSSFCIFALVMALSVLINTALAADAIVMTLPHPGMPETVKGKLGEQCIVLNRNSPHFERELLSTQPNACVIIIGSWIIKTSFFLIPTDMVSSRGEEWQVAWKDLNSPLTVSSRSWDIKVSTQGAKQFVASLSYHF